MELKCKFLKLNTFRPLRGERDCRLYAEWYHAYGNDHCSGWRGGDVHIYEHTQFSPSAARVSISGRVFTSEGMAIARARVIMTDQSGVARTATTNNFGYFRFDDVEVGQTYVVNVLSKQYQFSPRIVSITDSIADLDFIAF